MQFLFFQMLDQGATDLVGNAFRFAGGARGVEDIQRIVELPRYEIDLPGRGSDDVTPVECSCLDAETGQVDLNDLFEAGQIRPNGADLFSQRVFLAVIKVTVCREQEAWFGLTETIDNAVFAEIRRR